MNILTETDFNYFENKPYPNDLLIATYSLFGEHVGITDCFFSKMSKNVTLEMILQSNIDMKDFVFMTTPAFLFFLPSIMKIIFKSKLEDEIDLIDIFVCFFLLELAQSKELRNKIRLCEVCTKEQCNVIAKFLVWLDIEYYSVYQKNGVNYARESLSNYWGRFIDLDLYKLLYQPIRFNDENYIKEILYYYYYECSYLDKVNIKDIVNFKDLKENIPNIIFMSSKFFPDGVDNVINKFLIPTIEIENDFLYFIDHLNEYQLIILAKFLVYCRDVHHIISARDALDAFWNVYIN